MDFCFYLGQISLRIFSNDSFVKFIGGSNSSKVANTGNDEKYIKKAEELTTMGTHSTENFWLYGNITAISLPSH